MPKTIHEQRASAILEAIRTDCGRLKVNLDSRLHHITSSNRICVVCGDRLDDYRGSYERRPQCTSSPGRLTMRALFVLYEELVSRRGNPENQDYPDHVYTRKPDWRESGADGKRYCAVCGEPRESDSYHCKGPRLTEPMWPR